MNTPAYIVITPVRDEADYVGLTIESMVNQRVRPDRWIIVNDGSTDETPKILDAAAARHPWISVIHRRNRGARASGGGVVEAFSDGYSQLTGSAWQFLVELDGDLSFDRDYFSRCLEKFAADPKLGIAWAQYPSTNPAMESISAAVTTPCPPRPCIRISNTAAS